MTAPPVNVTLIVRHGFCRISFAAFDGREWRAVPHGPVIEPPSSWALANGDGLEDEP